jgi:hypothetical protein
MTQCWRFPACSLRSAQSPLPWAAASGFESGRSPGRQAGAARPASALPRSRLEAEATTKARRWSKIFLSRAQSSPPAQYNPGGATRPIASRVRPASFQERVLTCLIYCLRQARRDLVLKIGGRNCTCLKAPPLQKSARMGHLLFTHYAHGSKVDRRLHQSV